MRKNSLQKGFTLLELIVVCGLILLIASIVLSRLDVSREKARDTKKVSELKGLQTALELYQLDLGEYPQPIDAGAAQPAKNTNSGLTSMSATLHGIVLKKYMSMIPLPPKGSTVPGIDTYYYQTQNDPDGNNPECNGKELGDLPYIIYFYTEQPHKLPLLTLDGASQESEYAHGYCLSL